jgi:hypothetical protein
LAATQKCYVCAGWFRGNDAPNQWSFVCTNFGIPPEQFVWWGKPDGHVVDSRYRNSVPTLDDLPPGTPVLVQPAEGRYVNGQVPLSEFRHPENAVYIFGPDNQNVDPDDLPPDYQSVHVETASHHDMYSWVAAAIVLHDRMVKRG